jgi:hypothetical protein
MGGGSLTDGTVNWGTAVQTYNSFVCTYRYLQLGNHRGNYYAYNTTTTTTTTTTASNNNDDNNKPRE